MALSHKLAPLQLCDSSIATNVLERTREIGTEVVEVRLPILFPPWNLLVALVGTVALALLVLFLPVRRAVRFRPGGRAPLRLRSQSTADARHNDRGASRWT